MEKQSYASSLKNYVRLNWFKLTLLGMLVFVFLRKDLSFQFNLNSPNRIEEGIPAGADQLPVKQPEKKKELLTQKEAAPATSKSQTFLSAMELPFFSSSSTKVEKDPELSSIDEATRHAYVKRFAHVAISESKKYGIPASIILANAVLHSAYGQRNLTRSGNNHFGIACSNDWAGERQNYQNTCYRHYENAWASFRDHSLYLNSEQFSQLRQLSLGDFKGWARGLEKLGYSDLYNDLADRLIQLIETEELDGFDMR